MLGLQTQPPPPTARAIDTWQPSAQHLHRNSVPIFVAHDDRFDTAVQPHGGHRDDRYQYGAEQTVD